MSLGYRIIKSLDDLAQKAVCALVNHYTHSYPTECRPPIKWRLGVEEFYGNWLTGITGHYFLWEKEAAVYFWGITITAAWE